MIVILFLLGAVATLLEGWGVMVVEGALAHSMDYVIPTLSYESSLWLVVLFSILGAVGTVSSRAGN